LADEANNNQIKIFNHPVYGQFKVKVVKASTRTISTERNGSTIEFDLIEANVTPNTLGSAVTVSSGVQAATDFDQNLYAAKLQAILDADFINNFTVPQISLSAALGQITGSLSQVSMNINRVPGFINQAIYQCQQLVAAAQGVQQAYTNAYRTFKPFLNPNPIEGITNLASSFVSPTNGISQVLGITKPTFNVPTVSQAQLATNNSTASNNTVSPPALTSVGYCLQTAGLAIQDVEVVLAAILQLQELSQAANQNNTQIFLVVTPITAGQLSTQLKTSVETLLQLNPPLASLVVLPYGTVVVYPSGVGT
jgi:hypothetical protein